MACHSPKDAKKVWDYAKTVINAELAKAGTGEGRFISFPDLTHKISEDIWQASGQKLRVVPEDIARMIAMPKTVKVARNALLMSDKAQGTALRDARRFVEGTQESPIHQLVRGVYEAPYAIKTVGHSGALHMTHAWPYALDPANWVNFAKTWVNSWRAMKPSNAQAIRESIQLHPRYDEQIQSGLAIDPSKFTDDVQKRANYWGDGAFGKFMEKIGAGKPARLLSEMTSSAFLGLKQLRQTVWDSIYESVPAHLQTQEMRNIISTHVNHMTGASPEVPMYGATGKVARAILFAPSLDVARVFRVADLGKDTGITLRDATNRIPVVGEQLKKAWGDASPEAKWMARKNMAQWARIAATYSAILYANGLLLKHMFGSKEEINTSDPFKSDWLTPKGPNGRILQMTGGQLPMLRTAVKVLRKPEQGGAAIGQYLMGKLNPALSFAKTLATGKTFGGDVPAPLGKGEGTVGNWLTYATSELGPIATEDGIKEFSKQMSDQNGLPQDHNAQMLRAFYKAGLVTIPSVLGTHTYQPAPSKVKRSALAQSVLQ